jgi:hypothetical protein
MLALTLGALLCAAPQASASRKQLPQDAFGRRLLQQCGRCPEGAASACTALDADTQAAVRNALIARCGRTGFDTAQCCPLRELQQWPLYAACACSSVIPGLSFYVDGDLVMSACGCAAP